MKRLFWLGSLLLSVVNLGAADLPPVVQEAVELELEGRLGEALDRYRAALSSEPTLVQDEAVVKPLTIKVLSKAAHLSLDLGYGEEAWDLGGKLLAAKNQRAAEAGTLVQVRLYRVQGRFAEAQALFEAYAKAWPLPAPGPGLLYEVTRLRSEPKVASSAESLLKKQGGPAAWVLGGQWLTLPSPTEALGLKVQESVRLQVGAFKDWANALTLIDMLREKGWSPFTDVKTNAAGEKLHSVYLVSRQPDGDRARLEAQGLTALP